jgi:RNA polymerase sigma-70 factor (ECF subfamily)
MSSISKERLRRIRLGDRQEVEEFVRGQWRSVWRAAYAVTADTQLAEDAAQEAFIRALRSLAQLRGGPVEPWLRRIAVNCAIDQLRRRPHESGGHESLPEPAAIELSADDDAELMQAVLGLPQERRVVVVLHFWFDYTRREISDLLEIPQGTVASRLSRALDDLHLRVTGVSGVD